MIFRPPLKGYDIIIWLQATTNALRWVAVDANLNSFHLVKNTPIFEKLPIVDFQPSKLFMEELRVSESSCITFSVLC